MSLRKSPKLQPKPKIHQLPIESDNSSDDSSPAKLLKFLSKPLLPLLLSPLLDMSHVNKPPQKSKPPKKLPNKSLTGNNNNENTKLNSELQNFNTNNNKGPIQKNLSLLAQLPKSKQRYPCHSCDKTLCNRYYSREHLLRKHGILESMKEIKRYGKQNSCDSYNAVSEPMESEIENSEEKTAKISTDYNENINLEFLKVEVEDENYSLDLEMNDVNEPRNEPMIQMGYNNNLSEKEESPKNENLEISSSYNNMDHNEISNYESIFIYNQNTRTSSKEDDSIVNVSLFQCEKCLSGFNSIKLLKEPKCKCHQDNFNIIPINKKLHDCHVCGKEFLQKGHLTVHLNVHYGIKRFACTEDGCDRLFVTRTDLNNHIRKCHTGERPFHCDGCEKTFLTRSVFNQHRLIHQNDRRRRHECDLCCKKFYRSDALKNHKRMHSGEKPFKCSYCGKTFTQKAALGKHTTRIHRFQIGVIDEAQKTSNKFNFVGSERVHVVTVSTEDKANTEINLSTKEKKYGIVRNKEVVKKKS